MGGSSGGGFYSGGSGSGGPRGGGGGGGGGGPAGGDPCNLHIKATIHAPNTDYSVGLGLGVVLAVQLGGPNGRTVEVHTSQGVKMGSLIGLAQAAQLIECIKAGNTYQAEIIHRQSGVFQVLVTRMPT